VLSGSRFQIPVRRPGARDHFPCHSQRTVGMLRRQTTTLMVHKPQRPGPSCARRARFSSWSVDRTGSRAKLNASMPSPNMGRWPEGPVIEPSVEEKQNGRISDVRLAEACNLMSWCGFVQINDVLPGAAVEELRRQHAEQYLAGGAASLRKTSLEVGHRRLMITVDIAGRFNDPALYHNGFFFPVVSKLLGDDPVMTSFGSVCAFPGSKAQHMHADHRPLFAESQVDALLPCFAVTVVVPLVDLDPTVGTTAAWLGSHRAVRPPASPPDYADAFLPYTHRGSIYMMDYRLLHGGTPNRGDEPRPILYIVYGRPWFIDSFNYGKQPRIRISPSEFAAVPEAMRRLFVQTGATSQIRTANTEIPG
jgi:hypothetical protein